MVSIKKIKPNITIPVFLTHVNYICKQFILNEKNNYIAANFLINFKYH